MILSVIYIIIASTVATSLYLTITSSHIFIYFLVIFLSLFILKNYLTYAYIFYINFYWSVLTYNLLLGVVSGSALAWACAFNTCLDYYLLFL